ncbi:DUF6510 family protein [Actinophytocola sp.]|uniref:DUF6510 family protein n=1 Tax=Actinophytocola sp. TaxID=1872138 RepID=UPI003D6B5FFC
MSTISDGDRIYDMAGDHIGDYIDGNGAGGPFGEALGIDVTTTVLTCAHCGRASLFAETHVYAGAGLVVRCPGCTSVLARLVRTPTDAWLDLRGALSVRIPLAAGGPR